MPATADQPTTDETNPTPARKHRVRLTLEIDGTVYLARPLTREELPFGAVRGFCLKRSDRKLVWVRHRIADGIEGSMCTCGDQQFRQSPAGGECKHLLAARACGLLDAPTRSPGHAH